MKQYGKYIKNIGIYVLLTIISILALTVIMQLWHADLHFPFKYRGDSIQFSEYVKSVIDNGWFLENRFLGMPTGKENYDWPMADNVHFAVIKIISLFTDNYAIAINMFFIFTFILTVYTSYYVFRKFNISSYLSFFGSILYAFMGYHFFRNIDHLFLSAYYMNPLIIMVILWLFSGKLGSIISNNASHGFFGSIDRTFIGSAVICLILSGCGVYYAFFSCFFLFIAGSVKSLWEKKFKPAVIAITLITIIIIGGMLNLSPSLLYQLQNGKNPSGSARVYHETELYSLKISDLLLPVTGHRIKFLSDLKDQHDQEISFIYKFYKPHAGASLGIIGSAGFIFLMIFLIAYRKRNSHDRIESYDLLLYLSILNISALLISTVGSFNSFLAHIVRYKIRGYERISIFIAFFSIFAVIILVQNFFDKYVKNKNAPSLQLFTAKFPLPHILYYAVMCLLLVAGLYDQTGKYSVPDYNSVKKLFLNDKHLVASIEQLVPKDSMVFQLPYMPYPEVVPPHSMIDYDHLRFYLHSTNLRWSAGSMKGRPTDLWQKETAEKPVKDMIKEISKMGFKGIMINRNGYADNGGKIIEEIKNILHAEPIMSEDTTILFFPI
jgi:hypothetical protein